MPRFFFDINFSFSSLSDFPLVRFGERPETFPFEKNNSHLVLIKIEDRHLSPETFLVK